MMIAKYTTRGNEEARALELIDDYLATNWSPTGALVCLVFRAMWSSALRLEHIERIGSAMAFYVAGTKIEDLQAILTKMVKAKVLRSYTKSGNRLYEVNF